MSWVILIASGLLEAVWAAAMQSSQGFRRWRPTVLFAAAMLASMCGLAWAMLEIPTGTAYAVWVGVGAVATVVLQVARGAERLTLVRALLLVLLVGCLVGLKLVS
ncbi:QacE family quaternary ammonium compound efflux SMR transporter [Agrococcus sediminis]|uniref:QacE family quaternary ammonium compound efflux SMR transporter n=1 Tax=Agrococcus sediminis TaxID=2599924 RepID=A0A5M8QAR5_9MICO|nr:SMR family transporter [Agrococcus sediminis]KAA6432131.1 QacE family quaternary ammonium compound efflux SMR transporter [Agrococcus sediminis]